MTFSHSLDDERISTAWPNPPTPVTRQEPYTSLHSPYDANFTGGTVNDQLRRAYHYDVLGRIDAEQRNNCANTRQRAFTYDGLGRLTRVDFRNQPYEGSIIRIVRFFRQALHYAACQLSIAPVA